MATNGQGLQGVEDRHSRRCNLASSGGSGDGICIVDARIYDIALIRK